LVRSPDLERTSLSKSFVPETRQWLERRFLATDSISVVFDFLTVEGYPSDEYKVLSSWPRRDVSAFIICPEAPAVLHS